MTMSKTWMKSLVIAGLVGAAGLVVGCNERREAQGENLGSEMRQGTENLGQETQEGIGGGGEGLQMGDNPGVMDDGEGPLENEQTRPGNNPGIINDGEGPLEGR
jgi:hypothetical protein